jgi:hypothetical protein
MPNLRITFPEQAKNHFNGQADQFLLLLKPEPQKIAPDRPPMSSDHRPIDHTITENEMRGPTMTGTIDGFGTQTSKFFQTEKGPIGIVEPDFQSLERFIELISQRAEVRPYLTPQYIMEIVFVWFEQRYKGLIPQSQGFVEYLCNKSEKDVGIRRVGIPISYFVIQEAFSVGNATFDFYSKTFFDEIELTFKEKNPNANKDDLKRFRKKYQGIVFANLTVCGEPEKCMDVAIEETEKALMILRFLSPTAVLPQIPSYVGRMGYTHVPISNYFVFEDKFPIIHEQVDEKADFTLTIGSDQLKMMKTAGLDLLSQLIIKDNPNDLEKLLLNSISLFAKGIGLRDERDKLVFCLASIETLLLKNSSEPIQHSVGLRLAFITAQSLQDRKKILSLVRHAYELRSSYLHHGKKRTDILVLTELQQTIFSGLRAVLYRCSKFSNQTQLIEYIEDIILT